MRPRINRELLLLALLAVAAVAVHLIYSALWMIVMLWLFALGQG